MAADYVSPVRYDPAGPVLLLPGSRKQAVGRIFPLLLAGFRAFGERAGVVLSRATTFSTRCAAVPPANVTLLPVVERRGGGAGGSAAQRGRLGRTRWARRRRGLGWSARRSPDGGARRDRVSDVGRGIGGAHVERHDVDALRAGGHSGGNRVSRQSADLRARKMLVQVESLGIANLLLREPMYPEFIQGAATPEALAEELRACVHDETRRARTLAQAERLRGAVEMCRRAERPRTGSRGNSLIVRAVANRSCGCPQIVRPDP